MIRLKLLFALLFGFAKPGFMGNKIFGFAGPSDEPTPTRFLLAEDPNLKQYLKELEVGPAGPGRSLKLADISEVVSAAVGNTEAVISAESQDEDSLSYQLDLKGRRLDLAVSLQGDLVGLRLSSEGEAFEKEASFAPDESAVQSIQAFLARSLDRAQAPSPERTLADGNLESTEALFKYLKAEEDLSTKFELAFPLSDQSKLIVVKPKGDGRQPTICYIEIEGEAPRYLKIKHNLKEGAEAELYKIRHAVFLRRLVAADEIKEVSEYIKASVNQVISHMEGGTAGKTATLEEAAAGIKALFPEFDFKDEVLGGESEKAILAVGTRNDGKPGNTARLIISPLPGETASLDVSVYDRQYQTEFPLVDFPKHLAALAPRIQRLQGSQDNLPFNSVADTIDFINNALRAACPSSQIEVAKSPARRSFELYSYQGKAPEAGENACALADSRIAVVKYEFGFFHFIHIVLDNPFLKTEYMVAPNHADLEASVSEIFQELKVEVEEIRSAHAASQTDTPLLPDEVEKKIEDLARGVLDKSPDSSTGDFKFVSPDQQEEIKVKLANGYYRIAFMKRVDPALPKGKFNVLKEIYVPERNGYEQLPRIEVQTKKFLGQQTTI